MALEPQKIDTLQNLIDRLVDGSIGTVEFRQLEDLLRDDPESQQLYLQHVDLINALRWQTTGEATHRSISQLRSLAKEKSEGIEPSRKRRTIWIKVTAAAAILLLAVAIGLHFWPSQKRMEPEIIGSLKDIKGLVRVTTSTGHNRPVESGLRVYANDTIHAQTEQSSAVLVYPDGTQLVLVGATALTCLQEPKKVVVHQGTLTASVRTQPAEKPLVLITPRAKLRVLGTRFWLMVTPRRTDLSVTEGRVRVTRVRDGKSVEVAKGKRVVANGRPEFEPEDIPSMTEEWSEDFEKGLPADWVSGKFVANGLLPGSKGAVQPKPGPGQNGQTFYGLSTTNAWTYGLFTINKDTHLHFTYKLSRPGWVQILMGTRKRSRKSPTAANIYFLEPFDIPRHEQWWNVPADAWHTVSVPLSKFRILPNGPGPRLDEFCFGFTFSSQIHDRGLVIDRMWVTRGGTGEIVVKKAQ